MQRKLSKAQATKEIKRIASNGAIRRDKHFNEQMHKRKVDMQDVMHVLKSGNVYEEPEIHPKTGRFVYAMEGKTLDDKSLKLIVDINDDLESIFLMTVMVLK